MPVSAGIGAVVDPVSEVVLPAGRAVALDDFAVAHAARRVGSRVDRNPVRHGLLDVLHVVQHVVVENESSMSKACYHGADGLAFV